MAKMKVHELAKELDKQSKDVIAFLQEKGIDVKAAQSSIEDDAVAMVRKAFGGKAAPEAAPAPKADAAPKADGEEPKKKKKIIFVSNQQNSKMPGQNRPQQGQGHVQNRPQQGNRPNNGYGNGYNNNQRPAAPTRPIKPLTPPSPTPSVQMVSSKPAQNRLAEEKVNTQEQIRPQGDRQPRQGGFDRNGQGGRPQGDRPQGGYGQRPQGDRPQGDRQPRQGGFDRNGQGGRPQGDRQPRQGGFDRNGQGQGRPGFGGPRQDGQFGGRPGQGQGGRPGQGGQDRFRADKPGKGGFAGEAPMKDNHRDEEKRRIGQERDKRSKKDHIYEEEDNALKNKPGRFIKPEKKKEEVVEEKVEEEYDDLSIEEVLGEVTVMKDEDSEEELIMSGEIIFNKK